MLEVLRNQPFGEIALILSTAVVMGAVAIKVRQPVLIAYILVGILLGPAVAGLVQANESIALLSKLGVTVLLFVVGLKLDLRHVRHVGPVALATGLGQLFFTILFGFLLTLALGRSWVESVYVAVALTFSSTIIIVKLLSDKRELDCFHGRIAVGFLVVQDIAVIVAMMAISTLGEAPALTSAAWISVVSGLGVRMIIAAAALFVLMRWVLPPVTRLIARSSELLVLFGIAWGAILAAVGAAAGFSHEAGAFMAGFSLANTPYHEAIGARLTSIRDFLLLFFFLVLGAQLDFSILGSQLSTALVLSAFVLIGNPIIVMAIMGRMGYRKRTSFMAGLTVAQISEFSIVFVTMGVTLGHVGVEALSLTTLVGIVTITLSTYLILYSGAIYERISPWLGVFERRVPHREGFEEKSASQGIDVVVFGMGRYGGQLAHDLSERGIRVLGIDFDPEVVENARPTGSVLYGDAEDDTFVQSLKVLESARAVVATLPGSGSRSLLANLKAAGFRGHLVAVARDPRQLKGLESHGVSHVLQPFKDAATFGAQYVADQIDKGFKL